MSWEYDICLILLLGNYFWKKFHDAIAEATKALVPYFEVLHVGFIKGPCDANLVFCSCVLDARTRKGALLKNVYRWTNNYIMRLDQKT